MIEELTRADFVTKLRAFKAPAAAGDLPKMPEKIGAFATMEWVIRKQCADVRFGLLNGIPLTFSEAFERVYGMRVR
jgi:hypothetical protein